MPDLVLHPKVKAILSSLAVSLPQGILFVGERGSGKAAIAKSLAGNMLGVNFEKITESQFVMLADATGKSISVDTIREIGKFLKLKSVSKGLVQRIIIIENAELMTVEAQNALLKNLEEPPAGTVFILTVSNDRELLPTIISRLQMIKVLPPTREQMAEFFKLPEKAFEQNYNLSGGLPGLFNAITDQSDHPLLASLETARKFLAAASFERLKIAGELSGQKSDAIEVVKAVKRLSNAAIFLASNQGEDQKVRRWQNVLEASVKAEKSLAQEANLKLTLTNLALNL